MAAAAEGSSASTQVTLQLRRRRENPLEPRYTVPVADACTSLHVRWAEEKAKEGHSPPETRSTEIGQIHGSQPKQRHVDNGEPQLSLESGDIYGGTNLRRVGGMPHSIYGPYGNRPPQSSNLHTKDIEGAQAGTLPFGPKPTHNHAGTLAFATRTAKATGASVVGSSQDAQAIPKHPCSGEWRPGEVPQHHFLRKDGALPGNLGIGERTPTPLTARSGGATLKFSVAPSLPLSAREARDERGRQVIPVERG